MKIAVSQLVDSTGMPVSDFAVKASNAGFEEVELCLRGKGSEFSYDSTDSDLARLREVCAAHHVPVSSITISLKSGNLLESGTIAAEAIEQTIHGLECGAKLGARVALHTLGRISPELYYEDAYNNGIASLKRIAPTAEKLKIDLAIEFVWNGFLFSPLEMRSFIDAVGSPSIGFYFDPGNMAVFQYPEHWVRALGHRVKRVHMKDWKGGALNGDWTPLLKGGVNFPVVMAELRRAGYDGPIVSEVPESLAPWAETAESMRKIAAM